MASFRATHFVTVLPALVPVNIPPKYSHKLEAPEVMEMETAALE
jgi:hypothetical protein